MIPTLLYNAIVNQNTHGKGASFISTDLKGELYERTADFMQKRGYRTPVLDFAHPLSSAKYNIMYNINRYMDIYLDKITPEDEKIISYSKAERYAKALASTIIDDVEGSSKNEAGKFFTETAKGLVTGIALLVSEYGQDGTRHIVSVFKLIIELNGLADGSTDEKQTSKLAKLLENIDNDRIVNYVGAAMSADLRTSMNVFSSALSHLLSFIDAELEQMLCSHSNDFNAKDFIENPTAIYIICPDENTDKHFLGSLFIRFIMNDLIELARDNNDTLERKVLCLWDEFGNMPSIKNLDVLITAARSRGIRFLLALQSNAQLEKSYSNVMSKIIRDATQCIMFTFISPQAPETREELSKILGEQTIKSGSVSYGSGNSISHQMIGRRLMTPDEIIRIPKYTFVSSKGGQYPVKTTSPLFFKYIKRTKITKLKNVNTLQEIKYLSLSDFTKMHSAEIKLTKGMFD